ncbi:MAG: hypothetical protein JXQ81_05480 [Desulfuromonadales bacterium]|nr:hypothetical protein [Desulfuromonadales bacterium]MBN2791943.1 hypothetical protein [Desulfuromonadales bacterium]
MSIEEAKKIDDLFYALMDDVRTACELWHERTDDFFRRTYVKSAMSSVEGIVQVAKQAALLFDKLNNPQKLSQEEIFLLKEKSISLKTNGKIDIKDNAKLSLLPNMKFAIFTLAKVYNAEVDLTKTPHYQDFEFAIKLRNRVTHPKKTEDLSITHEEMKIFENGMQFFREATSIVLNGKSNNKINADGK